METVGRARRGRKRPLTRATCRDSGISLTRCAVTQQMCQSAWSAGSVWGDQTNASDAFAVSYTNGAQVAWVLVGLP